MKINLIKIDFATIIQAPRVFRFAQLSRWPQILTSGLWQIKKTAFRANLLIKYKCIR
jgi:hypothetical protein